MGRSQMQGTPWHYEYLYSSKNKRNSINCVYNTGYKCTCSISQFHEKKCVGEKNCTDFERCSFTRPDLYRNEKKQPFVNANKRKVSLKKKNFNSKKTVERGDTAIVLAIATGERIDIPVSDIKNPFLMKKINEIILVKCEQYKIIEIRKNKIEIE